jgi:hypothetical protein
VFLLRVSLKLSAILNAPYKIKAISDMHKLVYTHTKNEKNSLNGSACVKVMKKGEKHEL